MKNKLTSNQQAIISTFIIVIILIACIWIISPIFSTFSAFITFMFRFAAGTILLSGVKEIYSAVKDNNKK